MKPVGQPHRTGQEPHDAPLLSSAVSFKPIRVDPDFAFAPLLRQQYRFTGWHFQQPHVHDLLEIGFCHSGRGVFRVAGKMMPFKAGDVSVIGSREPHMAYYHSACVWSWMAFDPVKLLMGRVDDSAILDTGGLSGEKFRNVIDGRRDPVLASLVRRLIEESEGQRAHHRDAIRGLLVAFLVRLSRIAPAQARADKRQRAVGALARRVGPALDFIHQQYRSRLTVEDIARVACMSPTTFRRAFRAATGASPHQYLTGYRIRAACGELANSEKSVESVAVACGFDDPSTFRRAFKAVVGTSPAQWRARESAAAIGSG